MEHAFLDYCTKKSKNAIPKLERTSNYECQGARGKLSKDEFYKRGDAILLKYTKEDVEKTVKAIMYSGAFASSKREVLTRQSVTKYLQYVGTNSLPHRIYVTFTHALRPAFKSPAF